MKNFLYFMFTLSGVVCVLYLIGRWSIYKRRTRRYAQMMPIIQAMTERTNHARRSPGYQKLETQLEKNQVKQAFNADQNLQSIELPDGQLWTRDDM